MKKGRIIGAVCALSAAAITVSGLFTYSFFTTVNPQQSVSSVQKLAAADVTSADKVEKVQKKETAAKKMNTEKKADTEKKANTEKKITAEKTEKKEAPKEVKKATESKPSGGAIPHQGEKGFCGVVEKDGVTYNIINGEASKVVTEKDKTLSYALKDLSKCTDSSMSKEEKLKKAFKYLQDNYLEGSVRPTTHEGDWVTLYANDLFVGGKGDCFSFGAAFAYMAKGIGYTDVYACNSGGHGWTEINGKLYDAEWSMHSKKYSYYGMSYDEPCDVSYKGAIGWADWTHVAV